MLLHMLIHAVYIPEEAYMTELIDLIVTDRLNRKLGLYIVKTILEQHKEKINVTSENGVTTFAFSLSMDA